MSREETIREITQRLVAYFEPERIYLFGSAGRGDEGPDSDLDFCLVLPDDAPQEFYRPKSRKAIRGISTAVDLVRYPASKFDGLAEHVIASLPATVLREGRLLYDARSVTA